MKRPGAAPPRDHTNPSHKTYNTNSLIRPILRPTTAYRRLAFGFIGTQINRYGYRYGYGYGYRYDSLVYVLIVLPHGNPGLNTLLLMSTSRDPSTPLPYWDNSLRASSSYVWTFCSGKKIEKWDIRVRNSRNCDSREAGTDLGTSPRVPVVRLVPRRAGSISSLYGAKTKLKAKKKLWNLQKNPHKKWPKAQFYYFKGFFGNFDLYWRTKEKRTAAVITFFISPWITTKHAKLCFPTFKTHGPKMTFRVKKMFAHTTVQENWQFWS